MSTTPSTFNRTPETYTVLGGGRLDRTGRIKPPLAVVVLNRSGRLFRRELFRELESLGLEEVVCIEGPDLSYEIEPLSRDHPWIRFVLLKQEASVGERINCGIQEARSPLVFVTWSDLRIAEFSLSRKLLERVDRNRTLCTVPAMRNAKQEAVPTVLAPAFIRRRLSLIPWIPDKEGMKSIAPFDFCGLYRKERFRQAGGFDVRITNPYWQKLDFGFRAFLWGESILCEPSFQLRYAAELPAEDITPDAGYKLFYLKNLAVRIKGGVGILPYSRIFPYILRSDTGPLYAVKEFREVRAWIRQNRYRFKTDARSLMARWEAP